MVAAKQTGMLDTGRFLANRRPAARQTWRPAAGQQGSRAAHKVGLIDFGDGAHVLGQYILAQPAGQGAKGSASRRREAGQGNARRQRHAVGRDMPLYSLFGGGKAGKGRRTRRSLLT